MTNEELALKVNSFRWYHPINVRGDINTIPENPYPDSWSLIDGNLGAIEFSGKRVLDVGTRDGKYAFHAERNGATVTAVDNNQSQGAIFLRDLWGSKVDFRHASIYSIERVPTYDAILFFGVLYHLRYPMLALSMLSNALRIGGMMYIETSIYDIPNEFPLLYCPVAKSPYEPTSCSFFNVDGLIVTLNSFGCSVKRYQLQVGGHVPPVKRCWFEIKKTSSMDSELMGYWDGLHHFHS